MSTQGSQYEIIEKIGEGGMGTVFLANDTMLDRKVAIKQLNKTSETADDSMGDRFQQEALALARLNHPNITHLYSFIPKENTYWMVMEYVEGKTLEDWLHIHHKINHVLAVSIAAQMLDGLEHAHKKGIIHRDIKPANVMIDDDGEVKIMDFGIARMRNAQRITRHGKSVGTLEYMSPEQIQGQEGDERTDIYAVGNILYELLCGIPPYQADTDYQIMKDKLEKNPKTISEFNSSVPLPLQKIIFKALERNPEKRFATAHEFKTELEKSIPEGILPKPELTKLLKASQEFTQPRTSTAPLSIQTLLSKAKTISGDFIVPKSSKINKPVVLLAVSVVICVLLLLWNAGSLSNNTDDDNKKENIVTSEINTTDNTPEISTQNTSTVTGSLDETPSEMYNRISSGSQASTNVQAEKKQQDISASQKKTSTKQVKIMKEDDDENDDYTSRKIPATNKAVTVPAGKSIRVTLAENLSSEDESRDGDELRFTCAENVEAEGRIIIKKGARVTGKIVDVISSKNKRKKALVGFVIQRVQAADGSIIKLHSQRYRLFADELGERVSYRAGQSFDAELGRGKVW